MTPEWEELLDVAIVASSQWLNYDTVWCNSSYAIYIKKPLGTGVKQIALISRGRVDCRSWVCEWDGSFDNAAIIEQVKKFLTQLDAGVYDVKNQPVVIQKIFNKNLGSVSKEDLATVARIVGASPSEGTKAEIAAGIKDELMVIQRRWKMTLV